MNLARFARAGTDGWAIVEPDGMLRIVDGDPVSGWTATDRRIELATVVLLPPAIPTKILGIGLNYAAHAAESGKAVPEEPLLFMKPPSSLLPSGGTIVLPNDDHRIDFEAELAIVIGRRCRHVLASDWRTVVAGFTCGNDVSDRVYQRGDGQFTRAKGFDTFAPLGPVLATELDPTDVEVVCRVNGEVRQRGRTDDLIFGIPELIAYVSRIMTLEPWDVIFTGTPSGVGPLRDGDVVAVEVDGIGVLQNYVRCEPLVEP